MFAKLEPQAKYLYIFFNAHRKQMFLEIKRDFIAYSIFTSRFKSLLRTKAST